MNDYPLHDEFLRSEALARSRTKNGTYLLSAGTVGPRHSAVAHRANLDTSEAADQSPVRLSTGN